MTLVNLPKLILYYMSKYLDNACLMNLKLTCVKMRNLVKEFCVYQNSRYLAQEIFVIDFIMGSQVEYLSYIVRVNELDNYIMWWDILYNYRKYCNAHQSFLYNAMDVIYMEKYLIHYSKKNLAYHLLNSNYSIHSQDKYVINRYKKLTTPIYDKLNNTREDQITHHNPIDILKAIEKYKNGYETENFGIRYSKKHKNPQE